MICNECETVAHCTSHGCIPKTTKKDEALKLALEALEQIDGIDTETECVTIDVGDVITALREALTSVPDWASEAIEQPSYTFKSSELSTFNFKPNYNMTFHNGFKHVGVLDFNGPEMTFSGDMDESAKVFLEFIAEAFKGRLEQARTEALAEQPTPEDSSVVQPAQQEPVAIEHCLWARNGNTPCPHTAPPAQRTWVGLTEEEISEIAINNPPMVHEFAQAIEAKLKEKNT